MSGDINSLSLEARANLMLNDKNLWPVMCPACSQVSKFTIARLRRAAEVGCRRCGQTFAFEHQRFGHLVEHLRSVVRIAHANDTPQLLTKKN